MTRRRPGHRPSYTPIARDVAGQVSMQVAQQLGRGGLRVGDTEREAAAAALGEHYAVGRLDQEEYADRLDAAYEARTQGDLMALFRDLPQKWPVQVRRPVPPARHRPRVPFLPVLLVLVGVAIATGAVWVIWVGLGGLLIAKKVARDRRRHSNGSPRPSRGSWA